MISLLLTGMTNPLSKDSVVLDVAACGSAPLIPVMLNTVNAVDFNRISLILRPQRIESLSLLHHFSKDRFSAYKLHGSPYESLCTPCLDKQTKLYTAGGISPIN